MWFSKNLAPKATRYVLVFFFPTNNCVHSKSIRFHFFFLFIFVFCCCCCCRSHLRCHVSPSIHLKINNINKTVEFEYLYETASNIFPNSTVFRHCFGWEMSQPFRLPKATSCDIKWDYFWNRAIELHSNQNTWQCLQSELNESPPFKLFCHSLIFCEWQWQWWGTFSYRVNNSVKLCAPQRCLNLFIVEQC